MISYPRIRQSLLLGVLVTITVIALVSCAPSRASDVQSTPINKTPNASREEMQPTPTKPENTASEIDSPPNYLDQVWPKLGSTVPKDVYHASFSDDPIQVGSTAIGVLFGADRIAQNGDIDVNWIGRCSLVVDGIPSPNDGLAEDGAVLIEGKDSQGHVLYRTSGPYYIAWFVPLDIGTHTATFQVQRTTGEVLEYSWDFEIIP